LGKLKQEQQLSASRIRELKDEQEAKETQLKEKREQDKISNQKGEKTMPEDNHP
jgi:hypothetical protein